MLKIKEMLLKLLTVKTVTPSITATTGTLQAAQANQCGRVVQLTVAVRNSTQTAAGSNVFQGTIESKYRPKSVCHATGYFGSSGCVLQISADGTVTVRVIGAALAANSTAYVGITYLV